MDYEQKYKEALELARANHKFYKEHTDCNDNFNQKVKLLESIFPELAESEDERIRKAICIYLDWLEGEKDAAPKGNYSIHDMLVWLEKQKEQKPKNILTDDDSLQTAYLKGQTDVLEDPEAYGLQKEQKPAEWSEEDERMRNALWNLLHLHYAQDNAQTLVGIEAGKFRSWLKSLKPQPKNEWSEEDEKYYNWLCMQVHCKMVEGVISSKEEVEIGKWMIKWLNHAPNSSWKPSEEQMYSLATIVKGSGECSVGSVGYNLKALYNDLKKLGE